MLKVAGRAYDQKQLPKKSASPKSSILISKARAWHDPELVQGKKETWESKS
jgi:hypothetical protein